MGTLRTCSIRDVQQTFQEKYFYLHYFEGEVLLGSWGCSFGVSTEGGVWLVIRFINRCAWPFIHERSSMMIGMTDFLVQNVQFVETKITVMCSLSWGIIVVCQCLLLVCIYPVFIHIYIHYVHIHILI